MIDVLISAAAGIFVCIFGMWCFIRGQQNALQMARKEIPVQIRNPVQVAVEGIQDVAKDVKDSKRITDYNTQVQNMQNFSGELETDKVV
jgi:hypothetical protein